MKLSQPEAQDWGCWPGRRRMHCGSWQLRRALRMSWSPLDFNLKWLAVVAQVTLSVV